MTSSSKVQLSAPDGRALTAQLYANATCETAVVLAGAMGVPQRFYAAFATHLAEQGFPTLTVDYRDIGESRAGRLRQSASCLSDWAEQDLAAAVEYMRAKYPAAELTWVGHSVGGQLLGYAHHAGIARALLIAAQSGYWKHWQGIGRLKMWMIWHVAIPVVTRLLGRLPSVLLGGGDDIPPRAALEWAKWGRAPRYNGHFARSEGRVCSFDEFTGRLLAYGFSDDHLAPGPAVDALVNEYSNARSEVRHVKADASGVGPVGHFGAFRPQSKETLWPEFVRFLQDGL